MEIEKIRINDPNGLHLRRAAEVVKSCKKYLSKIHLCYNCKIADTCSILQVLGLAAPCNSEVAVIAEGPDEKKAAMEIAGLFSQGGGI